MDSNAGLFYPRNLKGSLRKRLKIKGVFMQNDLQYGFFVLCFDYRCSKIRLDKRGLLVARWGNQTFPQRRRTTNKPFFMLARNAGMEANYA